MRSLLTLILCLGALLLPGQGLGQAPASPGVAPSDTLFPGKTAAADTSLPKSRADTVLVVKHRFNHREQIITGSVVMTCLALMLVVMNNYNPR